MSLPIDWPAFLRRIERQRRMLKGMENGRALLIEAYHERATFSSFRLEGIDVSEQEVHDALRRGTGRSILRSRQAQRLRNHAAILCHIEADLRAGLPLRTQAVVRWYTAISAGLSTTGLDQAAALRLDDVVRRLNSPQMRIRAALREIATSYAKLLSEPLVPGFGGILARLLLRYHLGRCKLPEVLFEPAIDARNWEIDALIGRLEESFAVLVRQSR